MGLPDQSRTDAILCALWTGVPLTVNSNRAFLTTKAVIESSEAAQFVKDYDRCIFYLPTAEVWEIREPIQMTQESSCLT